MEKSLINHARSHYNKRDLDRIKKAAKLAIVAHQSQNRASGDPYVTHSLTVASTLIDWGMDANTVIAGILHDVVEDTDVTAEDLKSKFGEDVAKLVDGVTKVSKARSGMRDLISYSPRTRDNLSKLLIAVGQDIRVIMIKLADRLHNLKTLEYLPRDKQVKVARESLEVFGPMADRLGMGRVRMQIEDISFSYINPKEYNRLNKAMKKRLGKSTRKLAIIRTQVEAELDKHHIKYEIDGRIKSIYSLYKKLSKVDGNMDDIYDLIALRVIVDKKEDCYLVLSILHSLYKPMIGRIKDYISTPKPNGYQSLHTTVITPNEQIVEFQIRTREMHQYAERGLAASFHYHELKGSKGYNKNMSRELPSRMQWITRLQEITDKLVNDERVEKNQLNVDLFKSRIFVHSPKGDIFDLPEDALPLDFAYLVHSEVAEHASGFKVNGKIHPFNKPLHNGDVVEVITNKSPQAKPAWRRLVKTTHARNKLQGQLRKHDPLNGVNTIINSAKKLITKPNKSKSKK